MNPILAALASSVPQLQPLDFSGVSPLIPADQGGNVSMIDAYRTGKPYKLPNEDKARELSDTVNGWLSRNLDFKAARENVQAINPIDQWFKFWGTPSKDTDNALVSKVKDANAGASKAITDLVGALGESEYNPLNRIGDVVELATKTKGEAENEDWLAGQLAAESADWQAYNALQEVQQSEQNLQQALTPEQQKAMAVLDLFGAPGEGGGVPAYISEGLGGGESYAMPDVGAGGENSALSAAEMLSGSDQLPGGDYAQAMRALLAAAKPAELQDKKYYGGDPNRLNAMLTGILEGVGQTPETASIGRMILNAAIGANRSTNNLDALLKQEQKDNAAAQREYVMEALGLEKDLMKHNLDQQKFGLDQRKFAHEAGMDEREFRFDASKALEPKVYNTKSGLVVQQNIIQDGKAKTVFTPISDNAFNAGRAATTAQMLGAKAGEEYTVRGEEIAYDPNEPFAEELYLLGRIDGTGKMQMLYEQMPGIYDAFQDAASEVMEANPGASQSAIEDMIAKRQRVLMAEVIAQAPNLKILLNALVSPAVEQQQQGFATIPY